MRKTKLFYICSAVILFMLMGYGFFVTDPRQLVDINCGKHYIHFITKYIY